MKCPKCDGQILTEKEKGLLDKHGLGDMKTCRCGEFMDIKKRLDRLGPQLRDHCLERKIVPYLILSQELIREHFHGFSNVKFYMSDDECLTIQFDVDMPASKISDNLVLYEGQWKKYVPTGHIFDVSIRPSKHSLPTQ